MQKHSLDFFNFNVQQMLNILIPKLTKAFSELYVIIKTKKKLVSSSNYKKLIKKKWTINSMFSKMELYCLYNTAIS